MTPEPARTQAPAGGIAVDNAALGLELDGMPVRSPRATALETLSSLDAGSHPTVIRRLSCGAGERHPFRA